MEQQIFTTAACETKSMKYQNFKSQTIKVIKYLNLIDEIKSDIESNKVPRNCIHQLLG